jgi:glucokinase
MGRQAALQHPDSALYAACGGNVDKIEAKTVIDCAKDGDDTAMKVFRRYVNYLCMALDGIIVFFDPEVIILGGGVSKAGNFLLNAVRERLKDYILFKDLPYSRVEIARLGANAGMIGAAMLGKKFVEEA